MADNDGLLFAERRDQRDHVPDIIENAVRSDIGGCAGSAKPPHIRCHDMETRSRNRRDLMSPRIGQFRPAVTKHHERTLALFEHEDFDAIGGNGA